MTNIETVAESGTTNYVQQDDGQASAITNPNRKSKLFFNICDMRTATVALNIMNIVFTVVVALILSLMFAFDSGPYKMQTISNTLFGAILVTGVSGLGLYSAMNWRLDGIMVTVAAYGLILLWRIVKLEWVDALVTGLLLYPHIVFTMEMRSGVMTPETFDEEEFVAEGGRDFVEMAHGYVSPQNSFSSP